MACCSVSPKAPASCPRLLAWEKGPEGLRVETDRARYLVSTEDDDGLARLAGLIRAEVVAGVAGNC